eukprot:gene6895-7673_t
MACDTSLLQFVPFSSAIEVGFWHTLTRKKLEEFKLDDSSRNISGNYVNNTMPGLPAHLSVDYSSFDDRSGSVMSPRSFQVQGDLHLKNTIDDFKNCDKRSIISGLSEQIWNDIKSGASLEEPSLLGRFLLLTFADLKKYHYYYWFAFPALVTEENATAKSAVGISKVYNENQLSSLQKSYDEMSIQLKKDPAYFLVKTEAGEVKLGELKSFSTFYSDACDEVAIGFSDPSSLEEHPGWPLRNLLALISYHWGSVIKKLKILCYRDKVRDGRRDISHSIVLDIDKLPDFSQCKESPKVVGWEKNQKQKMIPRMVNLSSSMDPVKLAESAVDLNLKLMRWRLVPDINLEKIASTRCLLLGSGTLGCNVARGLMGWGVRKITLVDNSRLSYSNPVRQTLFEFEDCKNGGKRKAEAASEALKRIFPGVDSSWHELTIPMPGHAVGDSEDEINRVRQDVEKLEKLVDDHDVIFLLMDTRESRWLPTVLGAAKRKIVINAALGFDTFVVMRHGMKREENAAPIAASKDTITSKNVNIPGDRLGCYFCNDVVAPGDVSKSTRDRTLDQQCTVSRPGISMMASAMAVELLMSLIQHKDGGYAAADTMTSENYFENEFDTPLGIVPHQLRGFLSRFQLLLPCSLAFDCCTACSDVVVKAYREEGFEFLSKVFNVPKYLEDRTGLTQLHQSSIDAEACLREHKLGNGTYKIKPIGLREQIHHKRSDINFHSTQINAFYEQITFTEMASANVLNELTAQLNSKQQSSPPTTANGSGGERGSSSTRPKPNPGPKPTIVNKPKADEISSADAISNSGKQNQASHDGGQSGGKKKQSFFKQVKQFVRKPFSKKQPSHSNDGKRNRQNRNREDKMRAKSTSDLEHGDILHGKDGAHRLSLQSDDGTEHLAVTSGSENEDHEHKPESHGVAKFFGRKIKLRSSWKSKFKVTKKSDDTSKPTSSAQPRKKAQEPGLQNNENRSKEEDISTISAIFADDSFFQVSLVESENTSEQQIDQFFQLSDISQISESTPAAISSAAQDRIRIAPRGRRMPSKLAKHTSSSSTAVAKSPVETEARANRSFETANNKVQESESKVRSNAKLSSAKEPGAVVIVEESEEKPVKRVNPVIPVELSTPVKENGAETTLSDTVIIETPIDTKTSPKVKAKTESLSDEEFGSWEDLGKLKNDLGNLKIECDSDNASQKSGSRSSSHSASSSMKNVDVSPNEIVVKSVVKKEVNGKVIQESEMLGNHTEKDVKAVVDKEEVLSTEKSGRSDLDRKRNTSSDKEELEEIGEEKIVDARVKSKEEVEEDEKKLQSVFNAIISRTKSIEEELSKPTTEDLENEDVQTKEEGRNGESKKKVAFSHVKKPTKEERQIKEENKTTSSSSLIPKSLNLSFDMKDLDDMRSADVQQPPVATTTTTTATTSFQRSSSLSSGTAKPAAASATKSRSATLGKSPRLKAPSAVEEKGSSSPPKANGKQRNVPDWIAIAKEKHKRNIPDDDEDEDASKEDEEEQGNKKESDEDSGVVAKSQSFKETSKSNHPASKLPSRIASKSVKVSSPVSLCIVCDKPATQHERCDIDGQVAHKNCAKCSKCTRTINVGTIQVVSGKLYCGIHARQAK